jgi:hypothetical protein
MTITKERLQIQIDRCNAGLPFIADLEHQDLVAPWMRTFNFLDTTVEVLDRDGTHVILQATKTKKRKKAKQ